MNVKWLWSYLEKHYIKILSIILLLFKIFSLKKTGIYLSTHIISLKLYHSQDPISAPAKEFLKVAAEMDDLPFGLTSEGDIFAEMKVEEDSVILFKKVCNP